ncbi:hypothetical protein [Geomonas sp.]|uniref:hypothetical protein n=1 Tax=Geomonas sp. TaxID=2651584 RepID=UPI002B4609BB|nr:hypothetical protein [Geomonas sp.]
MEDMFMLDQCALIETKCAEVYKHFAKITADTPELEALWKKTALEEEHHALQFNMLARVKEGITAIRADLDKVKFVLQQLDDLFARIGKAKLTAVETLEVGIRLETYLSQYHCNSIIVCEDPDMAKLLDAMMKIDVEHSEMLKRVLQRMTHPSCKAGKLPGEADPAAADKPEFPETVAPRK